MIKNLFQKDGGFTLIEALVGSALLGGLALAGVNYFSNLNTGIKLFEYKYHKSEYLNEVRNFLGNTKICEKNFKDKNFSNFQTSLDLSSLVDPQGLSRYKLGPVSGTSLNVASIKVISFQPYDVTDLTNLVGVAQLDFSFSSTSKLTGQKALKNSINVYAKVKSRDSTDPGYMRVDSCSTLNIDFSQNSSKGTVDNFYDVATCTNPDGTKDFWHLSHEDSSRVWYNCFKGGENSTRSSRVGVSKTSGMVTLSNLNVSGACNTNNCQFQISN